MSSASNISRLSGVRRNREGFERQGHVAVRFGERVDKQHMLRATQTRFRRSKAVSAAQAMTGRFHYGRRAHSLVVSEKIALSKIEFDHRFLLNLVGN